MSDYYIDKMSDYEVNILVKEFLNEKEKEDRARETLIFKVIESIERFPVNTLVSPAKYPLHRFLHV